MTLRNIVEAYRLEKGGASGAGVCEKHGEDAGMFCEDCGQLFCPECLESEQHLKHTQRSVRDATLTYKEMLRSQLQSLRVKLETFSQERAASDHTARHIRSQAQNVSRQIKAEFLKLQRFLRDEEQARLATLREEEKMKTELVNERLRRLTEDIATLTETIADVERLIDTKDSSFLEGYKSIEERAESKPRDAAPRSGALIDVAGHLGSLGFSVWEKMQGFVQYTPVSLDVNSAHPDLRISDCLRETWDGQASLPLPDNPERFDSTVGLLGRPAFASGRHCWDVEVGDKTAWTLGVARASVARKGPVSVSPQGGLWAVGLAKGAEFSAGTTPFGVPLALKRKPRRKDPTKNADEQDTLDS
ncbi:hypothetical protein COCON_G00225520 [Conger conger]|uniref:B box-type domain-containing protein n=1 Tax=Conger conger TaxID=82655 RepID=A0A9Q1CWG0_CONCO|nr:hypothetical protein COCON_G00225520 [Conger conger]